MPKTLLLRRAVAAIGLGMCASLTVAAVHAQDQPVLDSAPPAVTLRRAAAAPAIEEDVTEEEELPKSPVSGERPETAPADPDPVPAVPQTPAPKAPEATEPQPSAPEPKPAMPEPEPTVPAPAPKPPSLPTPPDQPEPPAAPAASPAAIQDLQKRIRDLEAQVEDLRNNPPEVPAGIQQQLQALEAARQELSQRLQAVELHLRQIGNGGRASDESGASPPAGAGAVAVPQAIAPSHSPSGPVPGTCSIGNCRLVWTPVYNGCGCTGYVLRPVCGSAPPAPVRAPSSATETPPAPASEPAPSPDETEGVPPVPPVEARHTGSGQFSVSSEESPAGAAPIDLTGLTARDAGRFYTTGYNLFWEGEYAEAQRHFDAAASLRTTDARILYYRGLTEAALGRALSAERSLRQAAEMERLTGQSRDVAQALERLQGRRRIWLEAVRAAAAAQ